MTINAIVRAGPTFRAMVVLAGALSIPAARAARATTTTVAVSATSLTNPAALVLTATVVAASVQVTHGTILFYDAYATRCQDSAIVGRAQLSSAGTASIKLIPSFGSTAAMEKGL